ncbi:sensor histidine kinase (plasmid) [Limimaricola variabilis]
MTAMLSALSPLFHSLSFRFLFAGGAVIFVAAYVVGSWVADRIEQGVVQNSGTSAALYIESLIPNQSWGQGDRETLSREAGLALREVFREGRLSERVVTYNVWSQSGEILESYRPELRGRSYEPSQALEKAWAGEVASQFQALQVSGDQTEVAVSLPLLEVYVPIRDTVTGDVLAVVEFYQRAEDLALELVEARRESWMLVAGILGLSGALLFIIVHIGSRLIERQREQLQSQLHESRRLSQTNDALRKHVSGAAQRAAAQSEKIMQRIGQDLHDGVAQHLSLVSLRLESAGIGPSKDADTVRQALASAMSELRAISRGLALPDLARLDLGQCAAQAVRDHNKSFGSQAELQGDSIGAIDASYATKLCVYRFLQEALSNASRHAQATEIRVALKMQGDWINVIVSDNGQGFDPQLRSELRDDGGQGLPGLSDRAATLGGEVAIKSELGKGSELRLRLPMSEDQK